VQAQRTKFVVLYAEGASLGSARAAVEATGGTIVKENATVGVATVLSANRSFVSDAAAQAALVGAARNVPIGKAPDLTPKVDTIEQLTAAERAAALRAAKTRRSPRLPRCCVGRAPRRAPVGHGDDPCDRRRLVREAAG
jgi:hypothetical protein